MNTTFLIALVSSGKSPLLERLDLLISITLWISLFLCLLNIGLAIVFRKRRLREVASYYVACAFELAIFVFALLLHLNLITKVPYNLPPVLPFDRAQIGAALTIGFGLFPAAYWHRTTMGQLRTRMAQDAKVMKERDGGVHIKSNAPGEWMN